MTATSIDKKPLVLVTWRDAEDPSEGKTWLDEEDVASFAVHDCVVESVGYVISHTDRYVTIGGDWIGELKHWGRVTKIPTGMITQMVEIPSFQPLKPKKRPKVDPPPPDVV